jgi:hypothetical protein
VSVAAWAEAMVVITSHRPMTGRRSFVELCRRCNGTLVYVSSLDGNGVLDMDGPSDINANVDNVAIERGFDDGTRWDASLLKFRQNGACVDLSLDPHGWEHGDRQDDDIDTDQDNKQQQ